jgi:anti-sigma B factor antagonist
MSSPDFQHIRLSMVKDVTVIEILTKDLQGPKLAKELGVELGQIIRQDWANRLLVNFHRNRFLSSSGFAVLFNLVSQIKALGREVRFCGMVPEIRLGAGVVGLDKVVGIHESEDAAIAAFSQV